MWCAVRKSRGMGPSYKKKRERKRVEPASTALATTPKGVGRAVPSSASAFLAAFASPLLRSPRPRAVLPMAAKLPMHMLGPFRWAPSIPPWSTLGLRPGEEVESVMASGILGWSGQRAGLIQVRIPRRVESPRGDAWRVFFPSVVYGFPRSSPPGARWRCACAYPWQLSISSGVGT
jgi:hypothetical protein